MPWITLEDQFPSGLEEADKPRTIRMEQGAYNITRSTSLARFERVTWRFTMECRRRGLYRFGPATITSGDVFGFFYTDALSLDGITSSSTPRPCRCPPSASPRADHLANSAVGSLTMRTPAFCAACAL